jgi:hypothetical protein
LQFGAEFRDFAFPVHRLLAELHRRLFHSRVPYQKYSKGNDPPFELFVLRQGLRYLIGSAATRLFFIT